MWLGPTLSVIAQAASPFAHHCAPGRSAGTAGAARISDPRDRPSKTEGAAPCLPGKAARGFTLIELLVVMAVIGLLLAAVAPRYVQHVDAAKEVTLRHNLAAVRMAIDQFRSDRGRPPADLQELVLQHYLRELPLDPVTERVDTWVAVPLPGQADSGLGDIRSGAAGIGRDGRPYASW